MTVIIKVTGTTKVKRFLKGKRTQVDILTSAGIAKATLHLHGEVVASVYGQRAEPRSVDTSHFVHNIFPEIRLTQGVVFTKVPYAKYLEHGTSKIRPRKHFNNTKDREKQKIAQIIRKVIKKI